MKQLCGRQSCMHDFRILPSYYIHCSPMEKESALFKIVFNCSIILLVRTPKLDRQKWGLPMCQKLWIYTFPAFTRQIKIRCSCFNISAFSFRRSNTARYVWRAHENSSLHIAGFIGCYHDNWLNFYYLCLNRRIFWKKTTSVIIFPYFRAFNCCV